MFGFLVPRFAKLPKNRKFNYQPVYYDPVKDEIKRRLAEKRSQEPSDEEISHLERKERIKQSFQKHRSAERSYNVNKNSGIRFVIILGLLLFIVWYLYN